MSERGVAKTAVLFDWRGTLFHDESNADWIRASASSIGRTVTDDEIAAISAAITRAEADPAIGLTRQRADASAEAHRESVLRQFKFAGLDEELSHAIYARDGCVDASFPYPDAPGVLRALKAGGCRVAVVSDIHYDLRAHFEHHGLREFVDAWVFSFEHDFQKPEPKGFLLALDLLQATPAEALMVGDRASRDGGAAAVGITTLILPAVPDFSVRGLDAVLRLV